MPKTQFASTMKNRLKSEKEIRQKFPVEQLWSWQNEQIDRTQFVLHDGPPFANGPLHIGHFLNKIQKDIIVRYKLLDGFRIDFRPGWDCHGLPIELKALENNSNKDPMTIRRLARQFATEALEQQKKDFQSWAILADWKNSYKTFDKNFIADQLKLFWKLYKKGLLYRQYKPVNWSPTVQSALAESELEYNDKHKSVATYVRFRLNENALTKKFDGEKSEIYLLIWTTTPWSLIGNQAVAVNEKFSYVFAKRSSTNEIYLIGESLLKSLAEIPTFVKNPLEILHRCSGKELIDLTYQHPIHREENVCPLILSDHVTDQMGTGLVHIAPAHGADDFLLSMKNNLRCVNAVNRQGFLDCPTISSLHNRNALDRNDGIRSILEYLDKNVLHHYEFVHSYPYDWRTKKAVLILGSQQWFIDTMRLRDDARRLISNDVKIYPEGAGKSFLSMAAQRPYWCISRQRVWGVPIPVFYTKDEKNQLIVNDEIIEHILKLIDQTGSIDFWWSTENIRDLLPKSMENQAENLQRGEDIFDVWFDSGSSFNSVLKDFDKKANLYCEGHDQFNGWFLSSLLLSAADRSEAPFSNIFVHGFVVDKNNQKMSKSIGNVVQPSQMIFGGGKEKFAENGLDVCREWVTRESYKQQCRASAEELTKAHKRIYDIRNVLKFLLGNLYDFDPKENRVAPEDLTAVDRFMAFRLNQILTKFHQDFDQYRMYHGLIAIEDFIQGEVSSFYCTVTKDRLYCNEPNSHLRRSTQTVFYLLIKCLHQRLAPVMPHVAQELHNELHQIEKSSTNDVFQTKFLHLDSSLTEISVELQSTMSIVFHLRNSFHSFLQSRRSILHNVVLFLSDRAKEQFEQVEKLLRQCSSGNRLKKIDHWTPLEELLQCSRVEKRSLVDFDENSIEENLKSVDLPLIDDKFHYVMQIEHSSLHSCPRCRLQNCEKENQLCQRCSSEMTRRTK